MKISFGTDGWRAIIADDFNMVNLVRVSEAAADWLKLNVTNPKVIIGYDTRFGGKLFSETVAKVFAYKNIKVLLSESFCSTPMLSLGVAQLDASLGIIITASHNPPEYNGLKLKGAYGGPLLAAHVMEIEKLIPDEISVPFHDLHIKEYTGKNMVKYVNLEDLYIKHLEKNFDIDAIKKSGVKWAYDAMYGAGQNVIKKLFDDVVLIHCDYNPSFKGQAPEPIESNLKQISDYIKNDSEISFGLATDGDADRLGIFDSKGNFIDSHHMILMLIHYFVKYQHKTGTVITTFSASSKIKALCRHYKIDCSITKIGFKYICEKMITEDVLIGGEESGGIALKGHIPERDGIWVGMVFLEMLANTKKSLNEIIDEIYAIVGKFDMERVDLKMNDLEKHKIIQNCKNGKYHSFGNFKVKRMEDMDGFKYFFEDDKWIMIRPSGTEPVLRAYAQANNKEEAMSILKAGKDTILQD